MEFLKQDKVVIAVIKAMKQIGSIKISTATDLGTNSIHIVVKGFIESRLLPSSIQKEENIMEPKIDLSSLSNEELSLLKQQISQERSQRTMSNPNKIVIDTEPLIESHQEAIKNLQKILWNLKSI